MNSVVMYILLVIAVIIVLGIAVTILLWVANFARLFKFKKNSLTGDNIIVIGCMGIPVLFGIAGIVHEVFTSESIRDKIGYGVGWLLVVATVGAVCYIFIEPK